MKKFLEVVVNTGCMKPGDIKEILEDEEGYYVECSEGKHHITFDDEFSEIKSTD